jgi:hypothetical protein
MIYGLTIGEYADAGYQARRRSNNYRMNKEEKDVTAEEPALRGTLTP